MIKKIFAATALAALLCSAQDEAELHKGMKATGDDMNKLRGMQQKTGEDAAAAAARIATVYEQMEGFWSKRNTEDAVQFSKDGKAAALALVSAAKAGEAEKAATSFRSLGGTCRSCHDAHREKLADGSYKIK